MIEMNALQKVMATILGSASTSYSVRGAAKQSGVSVFSAKHALDSLYKKDMLTLNKIGRTYQYKADLRSFLAREWKILFTLEKIHESGLIKKTAENSNRISSIVLFGSAAIGIDDEHSDLDILIIADVAPADRKKILSLPPGMGKEVNRQVYTPEEWRKKASSDKAFYDAVIIDSILLYGRKPVVL